MEHRQEACLGERFEEHHVHLKGQVAINPVIYLTDVVVTALWWQPLKPDKILATAVD